MAKDEEGVPNTIYTDHIIMPVQSEATRQRLFQMMRYNLRMPKDRLREQSASDLQYNTGGARRRIASGTCLMTEKVNQDAIGEHKNRASKMPKLDRNGMIGHPIRHAGKGANI